MSETENNVDDKLSLRLDALKKSIESESEAVKAAKDLDETDHGTGKAMGVGMRATTELVVNVLVGAAIGWQCDRWLDTSPVFLLIFLIFGVASGFWNVYRMAMKPTSALFKGTQPKNSDKV